MKDKGQVKNRGTDMLQGSIGKSLFFFALPILIGNLFQQFYNMADSVIVGRFVGEDALAAVGASYSLTTVFISVAIGGGMGASVLTSQYLGAKDYRNLRMSVRTSLLSFLIFSIVLGAGGFFLSPWIMRALQTPDNVIGQAQLYLKIYFLGLPFLFMYNVLASVFNSLGKSRIPLYFLIFSSVLNVILDLFMVCVLDLGVAGVAVATVLAQGISAVISFFVLRRQLKAYPADGTLSLFDGSYFGKMLKIALPSILQQSIVSVGMMLVQSVVNGFGSASLAGFSAAMRIESLCIVPLIAVGNAVSTFTAQNIGAGQKERAVKGYRISYLILAGFALFIMICLEFFYEPIISMFLGSEYSAEAMATGTGYLRFMGFFFIMLGLKMSTDGVLRGAGDMSVFTVANLVNLTIRVAFAYLFAPVLGISAVWMAVPVGWTANYIISYLRYRTGKWKTAEVR